MQAGIDARSPLFSRQIRWTPPSFQWHSLRVRASDYRWCPTIDGLFYMLRVWWQSGLYHRVTNMKNQPPDFELTPRTWRAHRCLNDRTKTPPSVYCKRTAPKLLYVAEGLKYGRYHHDDVMQFSTRGFPKSCWSVGVSNLQTWVAEVTVQRQWNFFFVIGEYIRNWWNSEN